MVQNNVQRIEELENIQQEVKIEKTKLRENQNTLLVQLKKEINTLKKMLYDLNKYKEYLKGQRESDMER